MAVRDLCLLLLLGTTVLSGASTDAPPLAKVDDTRVGALDADDACLGDTDDEGSCSSALIHVRGALRTASAHVAAPALEANVSTDTSTNTSKTLTGGCCFAYGYGSYFSPCCLKTKYPPSDTTWPQSPTNPSTSCLSSGGIGGQEGWYEQCPTSANEADYLWKSGKAEKRWEGCCFSIGYGSFNSACCLKSWMATKSNCLVGTGTMGGGTVAWYQQTCPTSPAEANNWIETGKASTNTPTAPPTPAPAPPPSYGLPGLSGGCCFDIGYGAYNSPCCLKTKRGSNNMWPNSPTDASNSCLAPAPNAMGGSQPAWYSSCPSSADEANYLMQSGKATKNWEGCCFSYATGSFNSASNLRTSMASKSSCLRYNPGLGGNVGWIYAGCPSSASQAQYYVQTGYASTLQMGSNSSGL